MLKSFRQSQLSFHSKSEKDEPKKYSVYSIFPENVDLDTQNPALKNLLHFSGKNPINFRSPSEEVGKVSNGFERTIFLRSAAFDT